MLFFACIEKIQFPKKVHNREESYTDIIPVRVVRNDGIYKSTSPELRFFH